MNDWLVPVLCAVGAVVVLGAGVGFSMLRDRAAVRRARQQAELAQLAELRGELAGQVSELTERVTWLEDRAVDTFGIALARGERSQPEAIAEAEHRLALESAAEPEPEIVPVITDIGTLAGPPTTGHPGVPAPREPVRIEGRLFADLVLRESVVKVAALSHGVRRALSPETRNRIGFEMRREVGRSRKARKSEVKEALREYRARQRAEEPGIGDER